MSPKKRIALTMTGASGAPYFLRLIERTLHRPDVEGHVVISEGGKRVLWEEMGIKFADLELGTFSVHNNRDIGASLASGSFQLDAMIIAPCSMNSLGCLAWGVANNLILRTAGVQLKEDRKLILVPRETPLSLIHLRSMVAVREAGAVILPAMPGFYHRPESVDDLVDTVVDRMMDQLGLADNDIKRWQS